MSAKTASEETTQTVTRGQWIRLVVVYLLIPLTLLVSGGDLGWWQAWLYAALIFGAGIGGRILAEHRNPGLTVERQSSEKFRNTKTWDKVLAPLMAVSFGYTMVLVAGLDHRFNWSPDFPLWLIATGFILISLGYGFATWALVENRFFYSVLCVETGRGHKVCDSGPYRLVRHPGYAGNILGVFGIVLALSSAWALVPATLASIIAVTRTALEDETLHAELPGYSGYAQLVRYRLIPAIY